MIQWFFFIHFFFFVLHFLRKIYKLYFEVQRENSRLI